MAGILVLPVVLAVVRRIRARTDADIPVGVEDDDTDGVSSAEAPRSWNIYTGAGFLALFLAAFVAAQSFSPNAQLVPALVTGIGTALAVAVLVVEVRKARRGAATTEVEADAWRQEVRWVAHAFVWLVGFVVLVYVLGLLLAAVVFVPVFLWRVAELRPRSIVIYTVSVVVVLVTLQQVADIALPIGYLTPVGLVP
jgi:hypothetical protein